MGKKKNNSGSTFYLIVIFILLVTIIAGTSAYFLKREYDARQQLKEQQRRQEQLRRDSLDEVHRALQQSIRESQQRELQRQQMMGEMERMVRNWVNTNIWYHASDTLRHYRSACVRDYSFDAYSETPLFISDAFYNTKEAFRSGNYLKTIAFSELSDTSAVATVRCLVQDISLRRILYLGKNGQEWQLTDFKDIGSQGTFLNEVKAEIHRREAKGFEIFYME